jgi:uncharacterized protein YggT (Ycf19 family)
MNLIHFILNVAGILLWLNWRSDSFDPFARSTPATLSGTLRRAQPPQIKRWHYLAALIALLFVRAIFYWQISPAVHWTPQLDLLFVVLSFPAAFFLPSLLFSLLSFAETLLVFYFWLLALAAINRRESGRNPIRKIISLQVERFVGWPWVAQLVVPLLAGAALWIIFHPALVYTDVLSRTHSFLRLAGQSLLVGSAVVFTLKYVLPALLVVHLIASYVYLGRTPLSDFISETARNILVPLNRVPLRVGRIDFAPLVGIVLLLLLLHVLPNWILIWLNRRNLTVWPQ